MLMVLDNSRKGQSGRSIRPIEMRYLWTTCSLQNKQFFVRYGYMIVQKTYKVRLYPTKEQEQKMFRILGACRFVWNYYLEQRKDFYLQNKKTLPYAVMARDLTQMRHKTEWMQEVQIVSLQQSLRRLDTTYNRFFRKLSRFPKFKSKKDTEQSFQKSKDWKIKEGKLQIQSDIVIRFRGLVNTDAQLGTLVVKYNSTGKWYATITAKENVETPKTYTHPIGIDVGIESLAITSDGRKYPNIRLLNKYKKQMKRKQQDLSRKQIGSNRREKARKEVAIIHEKIANTRQDYIHKVTHDIVSKNHAAIVCEDLNVKGMMRNRHLSRALSDVSLGELHRQLQYKQERIGGQFIKIDRFYPSSKTCHNCMFVADKMPLSKRTWTCSKCSMAHDRDVNAAKVILMAGTQPTQRVRKGRSNTK